MRPSEMMVSNCMLRCFSSGGPVPFDFARGPERKSKGGRPARGSPHTVWCGAGTQSCPYERSAIVVAV